MNLYGAQSAFYHTLSRRASSCTALLLFLIMTAGRLEAAPPGLRGAQLLQDAGARACAFTANEACRVLSIQRRPLLDDIVEYTIQVKTGAARHDVIGIHRVVKETGSGQPADASHALFMIHGDAWGFSAAFLLSAQTDALDPGHSVAVYLAERGVDVWGIDLRWVNVPATTHDLSFMEDWDTSTHVADTQTAVKMARYARASIDGSAPLLLLGWSRGAQVAYSYAADETQLDPGQRDLRGLIPVDFALEFAPEEVEQRDAACNRYTLYQTLLNNGIHHTSQGRLLKYLGVTATTAPDQRSAVAPLFGLPGLTNLQTALYFGSRVYEFYDVTPTYHYVGGIFDENDIPVGLRYTDVDAYLEFLQSPAPFQSLGEMVDGEAMQCGSTELMAAVPYDDHLAEIALPLLYIEAGGGFTTYGEYTPQELASQDVTWNIVSPDNDGSLDFGHTDLWQAEEAEVTVWSPLADWISSH